MRTSAHADLDRYGIVVAVNIERQSIKLDRRSGPNWGQLNNRKLNEPSAMRQIQFNWTQIGGISVCSASLSPFQESTELLTGIVFGSCGKRSDPSCRGGDAEACSPFGARDSKEAPLLHHPSRCHCIVVYFDGPDAGIKTIFKYLRTVIYYSY